MANIYKKSKDFFYSLNPALYKKVEKYKLPIKYILSGGISAVVDLTSLYFFTDICGIWYVISSALAFILAFLVSFTLQKFWTFRDNGRDKIYKQMAMYFTIGVINVLLNAVGIYWLVESFGIMYLLAQIIMGALLGLAGFVIYRFVIFKKKSDAIIGQSNKNILIISGMFPPALGGPASFLANLIPTLVKEGYQVTVLTYGDIKDELPYKVIRISQKGNKFLRILNLIMEAVSLAFKNSQIYAFDTYWSGLAALIASRITGRRLIARFTGDSAWETAANAGLTQDDIVTFQRKYFGIKIALIKKCRTAILKNCQTIITDCYFLKKLLINFGIKEERILVVRNSVEYLPRPTGFDKEIFKKENNLAGKVILTVCRLVPWKGIRKVLEVLPDLKKNFSELSFIIIGDGPESESLKKEAEDLKKNFFLDIRFLGNLPRNEIIPWYLTADIYVLNTNYEGTAHTLKEALHFGTPIATTSAGGNPEIVINEYNGLIFNYNDVDQIKLAIRRILSDKDLLEKLKINMRKRSADGSSWETMVRANIKALGGD